MFGFVTFVYPDTVKLILAKGNPHFICDSRVLVKPYKEKGKVPDKYGNFLLFFYLYTCLVHSLFRCYRFLMECRRQHQQQQLERGEFAPCLSPSGLDSREPYDLHVGKLTACTLDCFLCVYFILSLFLFLGSWSEW